jgi:hypothetical protein
MTYDIAHIKALAMAGIQMWRIRSGVWITLFGLDRVIYLGQNCEVLSGPSWARESEEKRGEQRGG